jgi:hypothetical protein
MVTDGQSPAQLKPPDSGDTGDLQAGDPVLLAARLSRPSPPNPGHAAARSPREPGHVGRGQGLAATREDGGGAGHEPGSPAAERGVSLSHPSHRLPGQARIQPSVRDTRQTLTCGYGLQRTGWMPCTGLGVKCDRGHNIH